MEYYKYRKYKSKYNKLKALQFGGKYYTFTIKQPWFNFIKNGKKTVEGRLNKGIFARLRVGDIIEWRHKKLKCLVYVSSITKYDDFRTMLQTEKLESILPNVATIKEGENIYRQYYTLHDEYKYGVVAIKMGTVHESQLDNKYYEQIKERKKDYELRVYDEKRRKIKENDVWRFSNRDNPSLPPLNTIVESIKVYKTFSDAVHDTDINKLLPGVAADEAIRIYEAFPHDHGTYGNAAREYGVVRFKLRKID